MSENIRYTNENGSLKVSLSGRIDTNTAPAVDKELQEIIAANGSSGLVFDADELEYISSSGLRVLMKARKQAGKPLPIMNAAPDVYDILETTGFTELFEVSKKMRRIDVDGCEIIGRGFYGTVYRIDEETIVKVYASPESIPMIRNEKELARTALVAGVPTAISYDIVRVGDSYGSVFELLNARTLNDLLIEAHGNADEIIRQYAEFMRYVNTRTVAAGKLRSAKEMFLGYLDVAGKYIGSSLYERLKQLLSEIPEEHYVIHGDAQMKNIMTDGEEPFLIDMDTLCEGNAIFDLQSVYVTYYAFGEDDPNNSMEFLGITKELSSRVWELFVGYYFGTEDRERIAALRDKIMLVGCIRFLFLIDLISDHDDELFLKRVKTAAAHLEELAGRVDSLLLE